MNLELVYSCRSFFFSNFRGECFLLDDLVSKQISLDLANKFQLRHLTFSLPWIYISEFLHFSLNRFFLWFFICNLQERCYILDHVMLLHEIVLRVTLKDLVHSFLQGCSPSPFLREPHFLGTTLFLKQIQKITPLFLRAIQTGICKLYETL